MTNQEINTELAELKDTLSKKDYLKRISEVTQLQSMAMGCFCLGLMGVPLAITSRRKEGNGGVVISLVVAGLYYGLLMGLEGAGDTPQLRYLLPWIPNVLCIFIAYLFYRRARFS